MFVYDTDGTTQLVSGSGGLDFYCAESGTYYLMIQGSGGTATGEYTLSIATYADDHPDDVGDVGPEDTITVNGLEMAGLIEGPGEVDWFQFDATAGYGHIVTAVAGFDASLTLLDTDGTTEITNGTGRLDWYCEASGTFYVSVRSLTGTDTGEYSLKVEGELDDHPGSADETDAGDVIIVNADWTRGRIYERGDIDWFQFSANENWHYTFFRTGPLAALFTLYDTDGTTPIDSSDSGIFWFCPAAGTYYVMIQGATPLNTGDYNLAILDRRDDHPDDPDEGLLEDDTIEVNGAAMSAEIEEAGDSDWFQFDATPGWGYIIRETHPSFHGILNFWNWDIPAYLGDGTFTERIDWFCTDTGTYLLMVAPYISGLGFYTIDIDGMEDDHPKEVADVDGDDTVTVNGAASTGVIFEQGDVDWFQFDATAGWRYTIAKSGGLVSLVSLYDADGSTEIESDSSSIAWYCQAGGVYYVKIQGSDLSDTGSYGLTVTGRLDDHPDTAAEVGPGDTIVANGPNVPGAIETSGDSDWFQFEAVAGKWHSIDETAPGFHVGLRIYDTDGVSYLVDSMAGEQLDWHPSASGTYFLRVIAYTAGDTGEYTLDFDRASK